MDGGEEEYRDGIVRAIDSMNRERSIVVSVVGYREERLGEVAYVEEKDVVGCDESSERYVGCSGGQ